MVLIDDEGTHYFIANRLAENLHMQICGEPLTINIDNGKN